MKKIIVLLLSVMMALTALVGCQPESINGYATVVVGDEEFSVDLDKVEITDGVFSILEYLKNEGELEYTAQEGTYGAFLTKVGSIEENMAEGKYVGIWTSVEADFDVSVYASTKEYKGMTLTSSGVGVNQMTITDGAVILFDYISYE
jgi:hypothetical protein